MERGTKRRAIAPPSEGGVSRKSSHQAAAGGTDERYTLEDRYKAFIDKLYDQTKEFPKLIKFTDLYNAYEEDSERDAEQTWWQYLQNNLCKYKFTILHGTFFVMFDRICKGKARFDDYESLINDLISEEDLDFFAQLGNKAKQSADQPTTPIESALNAILALQIKGKDKDRIKKELKSFLKFIIKSIKKYTVVNELAGLEKYMDFSKRAMLEGIFAKLGCDLVTIREVIWAELLEEERELLGQTAILLMLSAPVYEVANYLMPEVADANDPMPEVANANADADNADANSMRQPLTLQSVLDEDLLADVNDEGFYRNNQPDLLSLQKVAASDSQNGVNDLSALQFLINDFVRRITTKDPRWELAVDEKDWSWLSRASMLVKSIIQLISEDESIDCVFKAYIILGGISHLEKIFSSLEGQQFGSRLMTKMRGFFYELTEALSSLLMNLVQDPGPENYVAIISKDDSFQAQARCVIARIVKNIGDSQITPEEKISALNILSTLFYLYCNQEPSLLDILTDYEFNLCVAAMISRHESKDIVKIINQSLISKVGTCSPDRRYWLFSLALKVDDSGQVVEALFPEKAREIGLHGEEENKWVVLGLEEELIEKAFRLGYLGFISDFFKIANNRDGEEMVKMIRISGNIFKKIEEVERCKIFIILAQLTADVAAKHLLPVAINLFILSNGFSLEALSECFPGNNLTDLANTYMLILKMEIRSPQLYRYQDFVNFFHAHTEAQIKEMLKARMFAVQSHEKNKETKGIFISLLTVKSHDLWKGVGVFFIQHMICCMQLYGVDDASDINLGNIELLKIIINSHSPFSFLSQGNYYKGIAKDVNDLFVYFEKENNRMQAVFSALEININCYKNIYQMYGVEIGEKYFKAVFYYGSFKFDEDCDFDQNFYDNTVNYISSLPSVDADHGQSHKNKVFKFLCNLYSYTNNHASSPENALNYHGFFKIILRFGCDFVEERLRSDALGLFNNDEKDAKRFVAGFTVALSSNFLGSMVGASLPSVFLGAGDGSTARMKVIGHMDPKAAAATPTAAATPPLTATPVAAPAHAPSAMAPGMFKPPVGLTMGQNSVVAGRSLPAPDKH